jgi:hypothetical protein
MNDAESLLTTPAEERTDDVTLTRVSNHQLSISRTQDGRKYEALMYVFDRKTIAELRALIPRPVSISPEVGKPRRRGFGRILAMFFA